MKAGKNTLFYSLIVLVAILTLQTDKAVAAGTNNLPWIMLLLGDDSDDSGGSTPAPVVKTYPVYASDYETQVANYKAKYGKSVEWKNWMLDNKARYELAFNTAKAKPDTITISFRYETVAIAYDPAWASETEHMNTFDTMASGCYSGYNFNFVFNGNTSTSYANIIAGIADSTSYSYGKNVYLHYETIFNHEFGHTMKIPHHYDSEASVGDGQHMPPGESICLMDRTASLYCSACRTALGIPLDADEAASSDAALNDILSRYP